ncbi:MAG TPA: copper homeostasis protein CutC [Bacteroidales bacterium]|mgnify:CR=1 FL=1|nr:copper homeostasis protein CutC [Bacteroidales bacterium]HPS18260.1 copper homeostasis protein CutC [Bacteroidales bacterium]
MIKIEVVAYHLENAINAVDNGAHRIELCASPCEGGVTPSYGTISAVKEILDVPVHVMIRTRGGDFIYTETEFENMKIDIEICKSLKVDGIVFGILTKENTIDKERCKELVELAKPLTSNFHRAFDRCEHPLRSLEDVIDCGFQRILTSGKAQVAIEGCGLLAELIKEANDRIIIMPGGGVRKENFVGLANMTKAKEFHTSAVNDLNSILNSVETFCKP